MIGKLVKAINPEDKNKGIVTKSPTCRNAKRVVEAFGTLNLLTLFRESFLILTLPATNDSFFLKIGDAREPLSSWPVVCIKE